MTDFDRLTDALDTLTERRIHDGVPIAEAEAEASKIACRINDRRPGFAIHYANYRVVWF